MPTSLVGIRDRLRASFFLVPVLFVVGGAVLGEVTLSIDERLSEGATDLPLISQATVDSSRAVLSTVATATIGIAGIAFSVSLLIIQLASSQYSPRVVHSLFRDPYSKRVMGVVLGTFTYCLVVLRSVRGAIDADGTPVVPNLSVSLAVVLGVIAVLATVAFINHSAHSMDISELLQTVTDDSLAAVEQSWRAHEAVALPADIELPPEPGLVVNFRENGWIQRVDRDALLSLTGPGGTVRLESDVGRYAVAGTPWCTIWPTPTDAERLSFDDQACDAVRIGQTRTMQQDATYGLRQLVDVGLRALSPGVNDPTTAQDAIFHIAAVTHALLSEPGPIGLDTDADGRRLVRPELAGHDDVVALSFDELRLAAREHPAVCVYLLEAIHLICQSLGPRDTTPATESLYAQARLITEGCESANLPAHDLDRVRQAFRSRFT